MWHTGVASLNWVTRAALQAFMGVPDATHQKVMPFPVRILKDPWPTLSISISVIILERTWG